MYDGNQEIKFGSKAIVAWGVSVLFVMLLALVGYYLILPLLVHQEASVNKNSYQNITAITTQLTHDKGAYERLDADIATLSKDPANNDIVTAKKSQQRTIIAEMKRLVEQIPTEDVPTDISQFIARHYN